MTTAPDPYSHQELGLSHTVLVLHRELWLVTGLYGVNDPTLVRPNTFFQC